MVRYRCKYSAAVAVVVVVVVVVVVMLLYTMIYFLSNISHVMNVTV